MGLVTKGAIKDSWPPVSLTAFVPALAVVMVSPDRSNRREMEKELGIC